MYSAINNKKCVYHIFSQAKKDGPSWCWMRICFLQAHNDNNCGAKGVTDFFEKTKKKLFVVD